MIDLIEVSREEFLRRQEDEEHIIAELGECFEDEDIVVTNYFTRESLYLGTIKIDDDGTHYLVPEILDDEED